MNEVVINQVLVAIDADDPERVTADAVERIQQDGTCWLARDDMARAPRDPGLGQQLADD